MLPITVDFDRATKLDFNNRDKVEIVDAKIIWKPFYKITYKVKCTRTDPSRQEHVINDSGYIICDAMREKPMAANGTVSNVMKTLAGC